MYTLEVSKTTSVEFKYTTNAQLFELALADDNGTCWDEVIINLSKVQKRGNIDIKLKKGTYMVAVGVTKGSSTLTINKKATSLKDMKPFTVNSVYPGKTVVSGTGVVGANVEVLDYNYKSYKGKVDKNGKYSIKIPKQKEYDTLMVKMSKS